MVAGGEWQGWKLSFMLVGRFLSNTGFCAVGWGQRLVILGIIHLHNKKQRNVIAEYMISWF